MKIRILLGVLIMIFGLGTGLEAGEIYQWVDKDGVLHFTDGPPPPGAERVEGLSETQPAEPRSKPAPPKRENAGAVEQGGNAPAQGEGAGAVEEDENQSTSREDYWRRKGWGNDAPEAEGPGPAEKAETPPPEEGGADVIEGSENTPTERKVD
jgi:hypothetical protein